MGPDNDRIADAIVYAHEARDNVVAGELRIVLLTVSNDLLSSLYMGTG